MQNREVKKYLQRYDLDIFANTLLFCNIIGHKKPLRQSLQDKAQGISILGNDKATITDIIYL